MWSHCRDIRVFFNGKVLHYVIPRLSSIEPQIPLVLEYCPVTRQVKILPDPVPGTDPCPITVDKIDDTQNQLK